MGKDRSQMDRDQGNLITAERINKLIQIESHVHYGEPPPPGLKPYVIIKRQSSVLLSAPHGARVYRNSHQEEWHEEDEYTAGMALLLSQLCGISVITTMYRTDNSDPNYHGEARSAYKQELRQLINRNDIRWVIDLHGASAASNKMKKHQYIDLGTRKSKKSIPDEILGIFTEVIEVKLGKDVVSHNVYPAEREDRTITAFCHGSFDINAVQVEMKPAVRVPFRRTDATRFTEEGPLEAEPKCVIGMMQAIVDFIDFLQKQGEEVDNT